MSHVATHVTRDPEAEFQLSQLMEQVAANDACIAWLTSDVNDRDGTIRALRDCIAQLTSDVNDRDDTNRAFNDRIVELQGALNDASCLRCFRNRYSRAATRQEEVEE